MNKKYEIKYSTLFYKDLSSILRYIKYKLQNPKAAQLLFEEILTEIQNRANNPRSYEKYFSPKKRNRVYYKIYVKHYIIFYTVTKKQNGNMEAIISEEKFFQVAITIYRK